MSKRQKPHARGGTTTARAGASVREKPWPPRVRRSPGDTSWEEPMLAGFRSTGNILGACREAQVSRDAFYDRLRASADFRFRFVQSREDARDLIRAMVRTRARDSDQVLIFLAKMHLPEARPLLSRDLDDVKDDLDLPPAIFETGPGPAGALGPALPEAAGVAVTPLPDIGEDYIVLEVANGQALPMRRVGPRVPPAAPAGPARATAGVKRRRR